MELSIEYMAGFFDGEGCINIAKPSGKRGYVLQCRAGQNSPQVLEQFQLHFGGSICKSRKSLEWTVSAQNASRFLQRILTHLVIKRNEAELAIIFQERRGLPGQPKLSILKDMDRIFYDKMRALKSR